jgi:hypothetical protein
MSSEDDKNPRSGGGEGTRPRNQTTGIDELRGWSNCVYGEPKQPEKFRMLLRMIHDNENTRNKIEGLSKFWEWQESDDVKGTRGFQDRLDRATSQCVW